LTVALDEERPHRNALERLARHAALELEDAQAAVDVEGALEMGPQAAEQSELGTVEASR
jgi:hypothetical protein